MLSVCVCCLPSGHLLTEALQSCLCTSSPTAPSDDYSSCTQSHLHHLYTSGPKCSSYEDPSAQTAHCSVIPLVPQLPLRDNHRTMWQYYPGHKALRILWVLWMLLCGGFWFLRHKDGSFLRWPQEILGRTRNSILWTNTTSGNSFGFQRRKHMVVLGPLKHLKWQKYLLMWRGTVSTLAFISRVNSNQSPFYPQFPPSCFLGIQESLIITLWLVTQRPQPIIPCSVPSLTMEFCSPEYFSSSSPSLPHAC